MRYFVYAPNGQRFGPADLTLLQQWVAEGRVLPNSLLEEETSGQRMSASSLTDLRFPIGTPYAAQSFQATPEQPQYAAYPRAGITNPNPASSEITTAWLCSAIGMALLFSCGCFPFLAIVPAGLSAIGMLKAAKARELGHPQGQTAWVFSLVVLILSVCALGLFAVYFVWGITGMSL